MIVTSLIGKPTNHSVSPLLFNLYASKHNLDYSHVKFNIEPENLAAAIQTLNTYGFAGVNITLPYKSDVIPFLDTLSEEAKHIGAVNTIKVGDQGELIGYNTDCLGALKTIEKALGRKLNRTDEVLVFGTGGAARAIAWGVLSRGAKTTVFYRNPKSSRTISIKKDFAKKINFINYKELTPEILSNATVIANGTSAGMTPNNVDAPINLEIINGIENLSPNTVVFDAIFNPKVTELQKRMAQKGAKIASGVDMMVYQGVLAFEHWTGKRVNEKTISEAIDLLKRKLC